MKYVKNLKINKKIASIITAFHLMFTPVLANAQSGEYTDVQPSQSYTQQDDREIKTTEDALAFLAKQEDREVSKTLTAAKFAVLVEMCKNYSKQFFDYPDMQQDIQNLLYLMNHLYMNEEEHTEEFLIENGYVKPVSMAEGKYEAILSAQQFLNVRADYNQSKISETSNPSELFDLSNFCYDETDRACLHEMFNLWVKSHLNGTYDNFVTDAKDSLVNIEDFEKSNMYQLFKMLTTLNAMERKVNSFALQPGAAFGTKMTNGLDEMQVIYDYLFDHYTNEQLSKYYDKQGLVAYQLIRNDVPTDKCTLLGCLVDMHTELQYICLEQSLPDLFKSFETESCKTK